METISEIENPTEPDKERVERDVWKFDAEAELEKAHRENHFAAPTKENTFISSDARADFDWHEKRCKNLISLCEVLDIEVAGMGIHGSSPVVFIDVRPSVPKGFPKKYSEIYENPPTKKNPHPTYQAGFDIRRWGINAHKLITMWELDV